MVAALLSSPPLSLKFPASHILTHTVAEKLLKMIMVPLVPSLITGEQPYWFLLEEEYFVNWFYYRIINNPVIDNYLVRDVVMGLYENMYTRAPVYERRTPEDLVMKLYALVERHLSFKWFLGIASVEYDELSNRVTVGPDYYRHVGGPEKESDEYWEFRNFPYRYFRRLEILCEEGNLLKMDYVWLKNVVSGADPKWLGRPVVV